MTLGMGTVSGIAHLVSERVPHIVTASLVGPYLRRQGYPWTLQHHQREEIGEH